MTSSWGSPPHTRGKAGFSGESRGFFRITPAHAGKREAAYFESVVKRDHPRTRGEKVAIVRGLFRLEGSPPHTRGKGPGSRVVTVPTGITPAHAGKSAGGRRQLRGHGDHPRTRGEKPVLVAALRLPVGSPPHTRGKALVNYCGETSARITPAHAGKRVPVRLAGKRSRDHPRTRGEKTFRDASALASQGSPPHTRGKD